jgi:hypothetical protein
MTFTEAAVEVLRLVGKPLHYKKITEIAIERNMLAHVGKTPEVTMSSRLATMVKRDRGESPIIKVKPGVFGLREFNEEQLTDLSGDIDEIPEADVHQEEEKVEPPSDAELPKAMPEVRAPERKPLPGADVFPEEDDDDEPILGAPAEEESDEEGEDGEDREAATDDDARASRRRKRKRRRGRAEGEEVRADDRTERSGERAERVERPERSDRNERADRDRDRNERRERDRNERERGRGRDRERERERPRDEVDFHREPGDGDLLGKDLAEAAASVLQTAGVRGATPLRIAEQLVRRGRLQGDPNALVPTVMAAIRADVARAGLEGGRSRFRNDSGCIVLTDFLLPQDVVRAEQDVLRAAERQRERARRAFLRKLSELPVASLAELIATWLNAEGVVGLRAVRRPGAASGELHFAGTLRRGVEEVRLAVVLIRDGREIGRERVIEARGATHYYGNAQSVWLVTFGQVLSGAREEGAAPAAVPIALLDGLALATAMERTAVGIRPQNVAISAIDLDLFDALRGRERVDRDRGDRDRGERERTERDRGERNERSERNERDRGERDRGERDRGERDRGERNDRDRGERAERDRGDRNERDRGADRERSPRDRGAERERADRNHRERGDRTEAEPAREADRERDRDRALDRERDAQMGRPDDERTDEEENVTSADAPEGAAAGNEPADEGGESGRRRRRRRRRGRGRGEASAETTGEQPGTAEASEAADDAAEDWSEGETADDESSSADLEAGEPSNGQRPHSFAEDNVSIPPLRERSWRDDERPVDDLEADDAEQASDEANDEPRAEYERDREDFADDDDEERERDRFEDDEDDQR